MAAENENLMSCPLADSQTSECQSTPPSLSLYASGPNDVWSLGIILVNLTCGRNPWKRASMDDSTFRAYRSNPRFLSSILPLSPELDFILSRIFEHDPRRRIRIPELRNLILRCNTFTTRSSGARPPTPPSEPQYTSESETACYTSGQSLCGFADYPPSGMEEAPAYSVTTQCSRSSQGSDHGSIFSAASSCSSTSSCGSYDGVSKAPEAITYTPPQQKGPIYGCSFAFSGPLMVQPCVPPIAAI